MAAVKKTALLFSMAFLLMIVSGCEQERQSGKGLYLPPGNIENGRVAFIDLGCHECHTIKGVDLPAPKLETPLININLGGEVYRVKSYGELITSIVNPNHIISPQYRRKLDEIAKQNNVETLMPSFNDRMTVTQLIDLVTFLDSKYKKLRPDYRGYSFPTY